VLFKDDRHPGESNPLLQVGLVATLIVGGVAVSLIDRGSDKPTQLCSFEPTASLPLNAASEQAVIDKKPSSTVKSFIGRVAAAQDGTLQIHFSATTSGRQDQLNQAFTPVFLQETGKQGVNNAIDYHNQNVEDNGALAILLQPVPKGCANVDPVMPQLQSQPN
jgi:hypothetical protein